jgi:hypothetical protein
MMYEINVMEPLLSDFLPYRLGVCGADYKDEKSIKRILESQFAISKLPFADTNCRIRSFSGTLILSFRTHADMVLARLMI